MGVVDRRTAPQGGRRYWWAMDIAHVESRLVVVLGVHGMALFAGLWYCLEKVVVMNSCCCCYYCSCCDGDCMVCVCVFVYTLQSKVDR